MPTHIWINIIIDAANISILMKLKSNSLKELMKDDLHTQHVTERNLCREESNKIFREQPITPNTSNIEYV